MLELYRGVKNVSAQTHTLTVSLTQHTQMNDLKENEDYRKTAAAAGI